MKDGQRVQGRPVLLWTYPVKTEGEKTMKKALSIRNGIVRNSVSERYYKVTELLLNPFTFVLFLVDLVDNH